MAWMVQTLEGDVKRMHNQLVLLADAVVSVDVL